MCTHSEQRVEAMFGAEVNMGEELGQASGVPALKP
jgi:hypothetical protein